ncbi:MAG TPA: hypothetical protein VM144_09825 [Aestuariivirga sp.]|nr:hypothetical protein [Aestuariivirga sp.]
MTARGRDFLNEWVVGNVPHVPVTGDAPIRALAQKLRDDASAAGYTIADLEIEGAQVEQFIRETIAHVTFPAKSED